MIIQINNESIRCDTFEEYKTKTDKLFKLPSAEIWISESEEQYALPCLAVLINGDEAVINYFGEDESNYVTVGIETDERVTEFCGGQYEVAGYQVIDKETANKCVLDFFNSPGMSAASHWEQL